MIIFGWGRRTVKDYGRNENEYCGRCNNRSDWSYKCYRTWFTLFFIPVIPYETIYVKECSICRNYSKLSKEEFFGAIEGNVTGSNTDGYNDGLTETQRNYRRQMAELSGEKE